MKNLILDCGGVLVYPSQGAWNLPCRMREILSDRAADIDTPKYAEAHRAAAQWLDESRLMSDLEEERRVRVCDAIFPFPAVNDSTIWRPFWEDVTL